MNRRAFLTNPLSSNPRSNNGFSRPVKPLALTGLEAYTGPWTYAEAAHLLRRTMFGARRADVEAILAKTKDQAVDMLLAPPPATNPPTPINYVGDGTDWTKAAPGSEGSRLPFLQTWWFQQMIMQPISISEKMTLFWANHFATGANTVQDARYMYKQNAMLRQNALGNFKELVTEIALDPAMLVYLNGNKNTKNGPNENFGRELQELFTIGKGPEKAPGDYTNYTEADIKAAARVLTGWSDDKTGITYTYTASNHDTSDKQFSAHYGNTIIRGKTGSLGGVQELGDLISMIFAQQATAQHICGKIYRWFVSTQITPEIEQNVINPLADLLRSGNYEIKPVIDKLLKSAHFFDVANRGGVIKNPADLANGILRALPIKSVEQPGGVGKPEFPETFLPTDTRNLHWSLRIYRRTLATMQQDLLNPPNVAGHPAYYQTPQFDELWINADTLQKRIKLIDDLCIVKFRWDEEYGYFYIDVIEFAKQTSDPSSVTTLINEWMMMLFPFDMTSEQKQTARGVFLGSLTDSDWKTMWNDYMQNQTNETKTAAVDGKLRPLLRHLMALAEYQLM